MKNVLAFVRRCVAAPLVAAALAAAGAAQAGVIDFDFKNDGTLALLTPCGSSCLSISALPSEATSTSLGLTWAFFASGDLMNLSTFTGTFELHDLSGSNDLSGTFSGKVSSIDVKGLTAKASIDYLVTDGDGMFKSATGTGMTSLSVFPQIDPISNQRVVAYSQSGMFHVSAVPEPGSWAMMGAGLLALGFVARRRQA